jgi:hypothetical protein
MFQLLNGCVGVLVDVNGTGMPVMALLSHHHGMIVGWQVS